VLFVLQLSTRLEIYADASLHQIVSKFVNNASSLFLIRAADQPSSIIIIIMIANSTLHEQIRPHLKAHTILQQFFTHSQSLRLRLPSCIKGRLARHLFSASFLFSSFICPTIPAFNLCTHSLSFDLLRIHSVQIRNFSSGPLYQLENSKSHPSERCYAYILLLIFTSCL